ncbi:MAG: hypothetical protein JWO51_4103 [Rhodospirillales bacterium]|jgi:hypothetical protein|nr:hypothetical protein [Rhodospirillales bacterium]
MTDSGIFASAIAADGRSRSCSIFNPGAIVARPISFSVPYDGSASPEHGSSACFDAFTWTEDHEHCMVIHAATQDDMLFARMMIPLW